MSMNYRPLNHLKTPVAIFLGTKKGKHWALVLAFLHAKEV